MYYSDPYEVQSVGNEIVSRILAEVGKQQSATAWTEAVYKALRDLGSAKRWKIHPPERPYKGEYLCDFTLHEEGYGCRVACESQWMNWRREHRAELEWAFDKLVGVKSDLKVFIFEGDESDWRQVVHRYLEGSGQILEGEAHLALRWSYDRFHRSFWIAPHSGENRSIEFQVFECNPNPVSAYVLDKYGNNAAVSCPECTRVYLVSELLNRAKGRKCPECGKSRSYFVGEDIFVERSGPVSVD